MTLGGWCVEVRALFPFSRCIERSVCKSMNNAVTQCVCVCVAAEGAGVVSRLRYI